MQICIGGTFNIFHKGHKLLVKTAVEYAGKNGYLFIGIAYGNLVRKKTKLRPMKKRIENIDSYLSTLNNKPIIHIEPIMNIFGPTLDMDFDAIIVSSETKKTAEHINQKRIEKGLQKMVIIEIPFVLADDGLPIQSSRIILGEIDSNGKINK